MDKSDGMQCAAQFGDAQQITAANNTWQRCERIGQANTSQLCVDFVKQTFGLEQCNQHSQLRRR